MKVCFWGTYRRDYSRNAIIRKGLLANGVEVAECHEPFLEDTKDRNEAIFKAGNLVKGLFELLVIYPKLIKKFFHHRDADFIFVGYMGHYDIFIAKFLSKLTRKKVIFDAFISLYDSVVEDRKLVKKESPLAGMLRWLDRTACKLADIVIYECGEHKKYFEKELNVAAPRSHVLYVGADDSLFYPKQSVESNNSVFTLLHYGHFVPLQGIDYIIEAAKILKDNRDVRFKFIGRGQDMPRIKALIEDRKLENIEFIDSIIPQEELTSVIASSDVCLGIFGESDKAAHVIPNKVYECLAMKKPVITGDTPSVRELFQDGEDLILCKRANGRALASAISRLKNDEVLRIKIAEGGYNKFRNRCAFRVIGRELKNALSKIT